MMRVTNCVKKNAKQNLQNERMSRIDDAGDQLREKKCEAEFTE